MPMQVSYICTVETKHSDIACTVHAHTYFQVFFRQLTYVHKRLQWADKFNVIMKTIITCTKEFLNLATECF